MTKINKKLYIATIITFCCTIFNVINIFLDLLYFKFNIINFIIDCLALIITISTGIFYLYMRNKNKEFLIQHYNWFSFASLANIINVFAMWIISFWIQIVVIHEIRKMMFTSRNINEQNEYTYVNGNDIILGKEDYIIREQMDNLTKELNDLNERKNNNEISDEEYEVLKQRCINKYMS